MPEFSSYIARLLYDHDCVIIPGFGAFVGNHKPSFYNRLNQKFYPPSKALTFNQNLVNNDGLLANQIARKESLAYDQAMESIRGWVSQIRAKLSSGERVQLERIGQLYRDEAGLLRFIQDPEVNYLKSSFGLKPIRARALEVTQPVIDKPVTESNPAVWRRVAVAAILLPFVLYAGWVSLSTPLFDRNQDFAISDLNPFEEKICAIYAPRAGEFESLVADEEQNFLQMMTIPEEVEVIGVSFRQESFYEANVVRDGILVRLREKLAPAASTKVVTSVSRTSRYHIIAGCFQFEDNAQKMVAKLQAMGYGAVILDKKRGLYRVSLSGYPTKREARKDLTAIRENVVEGAWLLRK